MAGLLGIPRRTSRRCGCSPLEKQLSEFGRYQLRDTNSGSRVCENFLYGIKCAPPRGPLAPPNLGRADGPPPRLWPSAASASVLARRRRDIRRSPGPPWLMADPGFGVDQDKGNASGGVLGRSGMVGAIPTTFVWAEPSGEGLPGQGRSAAGCSTLTGQTPPTPQCADEGRRDG